MFKKRPYSVAITTLLALVVVVGFGFGEHMRTIQTYIGESVIDFSKQSEQPIAERMDDNSPFVFPGNDLSFERFHFIYGKPGEEIHFPPARLIWVNQYAGVITEITINTSEQKEVLDKVYGEMKQIGEEFAKAGWQPVKPLQPLADIKKEIADSAGTSNGFGSLKYTKGDDQALIMLSTPGDVITPGKADQAAFVAEIWIHNVPFTKVQADKTYAARKKVNGNEDTYLPLSYWTKLQK